MKRVSLVKGPESPNDVHVDEMVRKAVNLIGGIRSIVRRADNVLIKPNLVSAGGRGVTTDPRVVASLIKMIREAGCREVTVTDGAAYGCSTDQVYQSSGMQAVVERLGASFVNVDKDEIVNLKIPNPLVIKSVGVSRTFVENNVRINVPVMKTHDQMVVTLGLKNLKGIVPKSEKRRFHRVGLARAIVDLNKVVKSHLTVVDAITAMEGLPTHGSTVEMDLIITGKDVVAVDSVASKIMGFDPSEIEYLRLAEQAGLGSLTDIEIVGEPIDNVTRKFKPSPTELVQWPGVDIIEAGACTACRGTIRSVFYDLEKKGRMGEIRDLVMIVGVQAEKKIPRKLERKPLIMGTCLSELKEIGRYVMGCPPNSDKIIEAMEELGCLGRRDVKKHPASSGISSNH